MRIADGVEMLTLEMNMMGRTNLIHPTLLFDDEHAVLVDVGMPGQIDALKAAVEAAGVSFDRIDSVILTHQDIDHIGGIQDVLAALGKPVQVYAHADDQPYIEGQKPPIKMNPQRVAQMLSSLPEDMRKQAEALFGTPPTAKVTNVVADGDVIAVAGGVEVIFTPGHTPGHISLYHPASKTLITGDAMVSQDGKISGPNPQATPDMEKALESASKFADKNVSQAICYHGGLCSDNVNHQLQAFAR